MKLQNLILRSLNYVFLIKLIFNIIIDTRGVMPEGEYTVLMSQVRQSEEWIGQYLQITLFIEVIKQTLIRKMFGF